MHELKRFIYTFLKKLKQTHFEYLRNIYERSNISFKILYKPFFQNQWEKSFEKIWFFLKKLLEPSYLKIYEENVQNIYI